jgi:hypothetical protein
MSLEEDDGVVKESQRVRDAWEVLAIFEIAYAEWKALGDGNSDPRPRGLERFDRGMFSRTFICTLFQWALRQAMSSRALCKKAQKLLAL